MRARSTALLAAALIASTIATSTVATTAVATSAGAAQAPARAEPAEGVHLEGRLPSGASYVMDRPADWNGTVLLYSHGYRPTGTPNPAENAPSPEVHQKLLADGYALIGSSYASTGWAVTDAVPGQLATLDLFTRRLGAAERTLAWGESYGGLITTALAERHWARFDGTLSMCGLTHGGVANWNNTLDTTFALKTLLAPTVPIAGFRDRQAALDAAATAKAATAAAQNTPEGRARIALVAALYNVPGHNDPAQPKPAPTDWDAQQANQYAGVQGLISTSGFSWRQEAEARAGGNPSWNTGVDHAAMLARSPHFKEVGALYKKAGIRLGTDLAALDKAPRITADPSAAAWMRRTSTFTGRLVKPQLDIHTTGDGFVPVQVESGHLRAARGAGTSSRLLQQAYVDGPGHCTFTPGETLAALRTLEMRLDTGRWQNTPEVLNSLAAQADPTRPARYARYRPAPYPRPYDRTNDRPYDGKRSNGA
ncbi:alpha/beta hydrolase family protein [Streptomyces sp. NPDC021093]|uniref:alpha/beta hydrolase family protein n=1 Tax=Streptomyces sp. NPDC021093 TaxID=3365112 RepID=UPI0037A91254